jgi:hypothetical protein
MKYLGPWARLEGLYIEVLNGSAEERLAFRRAGNDEKLLFLVERALDQGKMWCQGVYQTDDGKFCLAGALSRLSLVHEIKVRHADTYLKRAIRERRGCKERPAVEIPDEIETFNDSCTSFEDVAAVLARARVLAREAASPRQRELAVKRVRRQRRSRAGKSVCRVRRDMEYAA